MWGEKFIRLTHPGQEGTEGSLLQCYSMGMCQAASLHVAPSLASLAPKTLVTLHVFIWFIAMSPTMSPTWQYSIMYVFYCLIIMS